MTGQELPVKQVKKSPGWLFNVNTRRSQLVVHITEVGRLDRRLSSPTLSMGFFSRVVPSAQTTAAFTEKQSGFSTLRSNPWSESKSSRHRWFSRSRHRSSRCTGSCRPYLWFIKTKCRPVLMQEASFFDSSGLAGGGGLRPL